MDGREGEGEGEKEKMELRGACGERSVTNRNVVPMDMCLTI